MELKFDKLLAVNIKRLTRPKFKHEFPQFNDPNILEYQPNKAEDKSAWGIQGAHTNDVAYGGVSSDQSLSYLSYFGRICTGEHFKVLLTIMNSSANYSLQRLRITVRVTRQNQNRQHSIDKRQGDQTLLQETIAVLNPRDQMGFPISFKVDHAD